MRGLDVGWAAVALGIEAVQREVFVVAAAHGRLETLYRGSLVAAGLAGGDLSSVELAFGRVSRMNSSVGSRARESAV